MIRKLYLHSIVILVSVFYTHMGSYACSMPGEPYFMVHPSFEGVTKFEKDGYTSTKEFFNKQLGKSWVNDSSRIIIKTKEVIENYVQVPIKIILQDGHQFNRIEIVMILESSVNGKVYPYYVAEFDLKNHLVSEIAFRSKIFEQKGKLLAIGYSASNKAYISSEKKIYNRGVGCNGLVYVPTLELAKQRNKLQCDYYHEGKGKDLDWSHVPACKLYEEL